MSALNFNAANVEPQQALEALPAGDYPVIVTDSEMKQTKMGDGQYLQCTCQVIDGPFKNRLIFWRFNLVNNNATAVDIAQRQLSSLCHAVGKLQVQDSSELHNIPFIVKVKVRTNAEYGNSNDVVAAKPYSSAPQPSYQVSPPTQQAQPAFTPPQQTQQPAAANPPWQAAAA